MINDDEQLNMNFEFMKHRQLKSFICVGTTFIDIKQTIGFSFLDNPDGYLIIQFVYESGRALNALIEDRNEFSQFLLELEPFIDDNISMTSMEKFMDKIEKAAGKYNPVDKIKKRKYKRKSNDTNNLEK